MGSANPRRTRHAVQARQPAKATLLIDGEYVPVTNNPQLDLIDRLP